MLMLSMSRIISELLGAREPSFSLMIRRLEKAADYPAADIKLSTEIKQRIRDKSKELGLDPDDSSPKELYSALIKLADLHDTHLRKVLGLADSNSTQDVLNKICNLAKKIDLPNNAWVLKTAVAKHLLQKTPPKNLMKLLGYRSVDSMLKRTNTSEIYIGSQICESDLWKKRFAAELKKVEPHDFESRRIEIITLDSEKWVATARAFAVSNRHNVAVSFEMGVIALLPLPKSDSRGLVLTILPLIIEMINEIRINSAYLKMRQVLPGFGKSVAGVFHKNADHIMSLHGIGLPWRSVHKHLTSKGSNSYTDILEPHIQVEDIFLKKAEEALFYLEPSLAFWCDLDFVGTSTNHNSVSFNLLDMAINNLNNAPFGKQSAVHLKNALWNKMLSAYMSQPSIEARIINQLDENLNGNAFRANAFSRVAM